MITSAELITAANLDEYQAFVDACEGKMIYNSIPYLDMLNDVLNDSQRFIFAARSGGKIVGSFCAFVAKHSAGTVLNALPYYGSHGDLLISEKGPNRAQVAKELLGSLESIIDSHQVGSVNIVSHPFASIISEAGGFGLAAWDRRIGQISQLPASRSRENALENVLAQCQQKTRNLVRKGLKQGFKIEESNRESDWHELAKWHRHGMERIGGRFKSEGEFLLLRRRLESKGLCKLYVAKMDGAFAGGLLNLYFGKWVEYFTPVAVEEFRGAQVVSSLIAHAMCDAILQGRKLWNWGGTWPSQTGVHHFKQGWGARSFSYNYYGYVRDNRLREMAPCEIRERFPFYYVRPFS